MTITRPELSVLARWRSAMSTLVPSEGRVAAIVLERPGDVVGWSTAELAQAAGTSTSRDCGHVDEPRRRARRRAETAGTGFRMGDRVGIEVAEARIYPDAPAAAAVMSAPA